MFEFDNIITAETIINAVSIILSVGGGIWAAFTSTKKYELTENLKAELMQWYSETVGIMIEVLHLIQNEAENEAFYTKKNDLLCRLSAQIEIGRFYFPNLDRKNGHGSEKPAAYRGYRNLVLEYLMHFYRQASASDCKQRLYNLWELERGFTSKIFELINPAKRNKLHSKNTDLYLRDGQTLDDYLRENPVAADIFY